MALVGVTGLVYAQNFEAADFSITQALLEHGVNILAFPQLAALVDHCSASSCNIACDSLREIYDSDTISTQDETSYADFTASYWSANQGKLQPQCIFYPSTPSQVSVLVLLSRLTQCPFAAKSGGHAAFAGASNIHGGITVSFQRLDSIQLSADHKTVAIQPGNTWSAIYTELARYDLAVIGGRSAPIGIGGLTTGGGISFFSSMYGLACDNVASYDVVTASGRIITVTPTQHPDLFWALRGGGNNFGLVVNFTLETISLPGSELWGGSRMSTEETFPAVIDAFASIVTDSPSDPRAGTWVSWIVYEGSKLAVNELWYTEPNGNNAAIFDKVKKIVAISDDTQNRTLADYTRKVDGDNINGRREMYYTLTTKASLEVAEAAKDIFFEEIKPVSGLAGAFPAMIWQAFTIGELKEMTKNGGNPLGLSAKDGPLYIILIACWWEKEEDDAAIYQMISTVLERIKAKAASLGLQNDYIYMNYASMFQDVISSYGPDNKARLKDVASKYDPTRLFQELQPGYFKLDGPPVSDSGYFSF